MYVYMTLRSYKVSLLSKYLKWGGEDHRHVCGMKNKKT